MRVLRALALISIAGWLGIMAFFSLGALPLLVRAIDPVSTGQVLVALLPAYYTWGAVLGAIALVAGVLQVASGREGRLRPLAGAALRAVTLACSCGRRPSSRRARWLPGAAFLCLEVLSLPSRRGR